MQIKNVIRSAPKSPSFWLILILLLSLSIQMLAVVGMPLFSDSAFHASIIRKIVDSGDFPIYSPVGWVALDMNPTSFAPYLTHPPLFYMLNSILVTSKISIVASLTIASVLPTVLSVYFFYKLIYLFFKRYSIALISAVLLALMPMSIWLVSHRIMEPYQYLMGICAFYFAKKYIETSKIENLILTSIFATCILYIKITSLFVVVALAIYLISSKIGFKKIMLFSCVIILLYLPYFTFSVLSRGTISYAPPGFPIIDSKVLNPWWSRPLSNSEKHLNQLSNQDDLMQRLRKMDAARRGFLQENIKDKDIANILQYYNIFPVSDDANIHWFSKLTTYSGIFLFLTLVGIVIYIKKYRTSKYHFVLIPLFILTTAYLTKVAELRYFYTLNILLTVMIALSLTEFYSVFRSAYLKIFFSLSIAIVMATITFSEIQHSHQYKNSFIHNLQPEGSGVSELGKVNQMLIKDSNQNIFTPANSEVSYYLDRRTIWDYRLFFVDEATLRKYLKAYDVSIIIVPNNYLNPSIYSFIKSQEVENTKANWQGQSIPVDSNFYKFINNNDKVELAQQFNAFRVYKVKS
jgi:hypothetical protein